MRQAGPAGSAGTLVHDMSTIYVGCLGSWRGHRSPVKSGNRTCVSA